MIQRVEDVEWREVDALDDSDRGPDGWGSTGTRTLSARRVRVAPVHDRKIPLRLIACSKGRIARRSSPSSPARPKALGYSTLFVPDHFVDHDLAPTVALAHAAAVTDTLRVGTFVLGNDYKHPVVLAREMATLDLLSDGRLELGIGAGWMTADYEKAGIPLDRPGVRIARLAESITIIKGLFGRGPFTFHGEHYQVTELDGQPKPVQQPRRRSSSVAVARRSSPSRRARPRSSGSTRTCARATGTRPTPRSR